MILQAFQIKSNVSRFSGFVWHDNEVTWYILKRACYGHYAWAFNLNEFHEKYERASAFEMINCELLLMRNELMKSLGARVISCTCLTFAGKAEV